MIGSGYFEEDDESECCRNGHLDGCDSLEPAWDIGDLIARSGCLGCCPSHVPTGLQSEQDSASERARQLFGRRKGRR